jgi:hypothetical protein
MNATEMAVAVAQQNAENDRKVSFEYLVQKAWRVVHSCKTIEQARLAMIYLDLMAEQYPQMDILPMKNELRTLFDGAI